MNSFKIVLSSLIVATALGCGGSDSAGPATRRNDPGIGTSTLRVVADVEAQDVPGGFITDFEVSIRDGLGQRVSGATVTVRNAALGTVTLQETATGSGDYFAGRLSFPSGDFRLDVVRGTDRVSRVVVGGPGVHTITSPTRNSTVTANQALRLTWTRPAEAKSAEVETNDFGPALIPDAGVYTIPAAENPSTNDQRIRVYRYNEVDIAGGLTGSRMRVEVRNTVEPVIVR